MYSHVNILLCDALESIGRNDLYPYVIGHFSVHRGDNSDMGCLTKLCVFIQERELFNNNTIIIQLKQFDSFSTD